MLNFFVINQQPVNLLFLITGLLISGVLFYVSIISAIEKEYRAFRVSFLLSVLVLMPFLIIYLTDFQHKDILVYAVLLLVYLSLIILFIPLNNFVPRSYEVPKEKHDERDVMFSRNELQPATEKYEAYYNANPDKKPLDDNFRTKPGLLAKEASLYHPITFASAHANLEVIEALKPIVEGPVSKEKVNLDSKQLSYYLKAWCEKLGTHSVGITELKDYHLYSHKGRRDLYGKEVTTKHKYAIAITTEMDHGMIHAAPKGPVVMESTQQYLHSGTIALQIAHFIRNLGFPAKAHIDGNYEVICPLVARDAGLGEIGRMGLLMTPSLGPRVRIAVVTTDIPLLVNQRKDRPSVIDFCEICKKCADVCPSQSISKESREEIHGTLRWKINSESCFTYWCSSGTDCGRCMAVCPYSHPNNLMHNFIRWGIKNSFIFRRFALSMDDLFYGRKPKSAKIPEWIDL